MTDSHKITDAQWQGIDFGFSVGFFALALLIAIMAAMLWGVIQ